MLDSILALYQKFPELSKDLIYGSKTGNSLINPLGIFAQGLRNSTYSSSEKPEEAGLWVRLNDKLFSYFNQELYEKVDDSMRVIEVSQHSKELRQTLRILRKLERASLYAKNIINTLQESENTFIIEITRSTKSYMLLPIPEGRLGMLNNNAYAFQIIDTKELVVDYAPFVKIGSGAVIRWNPDHKLINLAHELSHAYDANYGLLDDRLRMINRKVMVAREVRALYHENIIRQELKKRLRTEANGIPVMIVNGQPYTYPLPASARI